MKITPSYLWLTLVLGCFYSCSQKEEQKDIQSEVPLLKKTEVLLITPALNCLALYSYP